MFTPRISLPPLCRGLGGLEGSSQRSLQRNGTIRKTFSGGMAAIRRHSHCITVKLQAVSRTSPMRYSPVVSLDGFSLCHCRRPAGCSGEPDSSSQAGVPAVRPCKGRRWEFRRPDAPSPAALHADPVGPAVPPHRSARCLG